MKVVKGYIHRTCIGGKFGSEFMGVGTFGSACMCSLFQLLRLVKLSLMTMIVHACGVGYAHAQALLQEGWW